MQQSNAPGSSLLPLDLFDDVDAGIFVIDARGDVVDANRAAADMLGYTREELRGMNIAAFTHPEDIVDCGERGAITPGRPLTSRRRFRHKNGEYRVTDGRARRLDDGRLVSVVRDVTAADETAARPRNESTEELRFMANAVPALIAYLDRDARYVWANESYRRWLGHPPEEIPGRHVSDVLGPAAWASVRPYVERVLAGEEVTFDYQLVHDGRDARDRRVTYVPHRDACGEVRGFVVLSNDITEIRNAERETLRTQEALRRSEERYRCLVGAITSVVWTADAEGRFVEPQPAWEAYTGQRWEDYRDRGWTAAVHADDRERIEAVWTRATRTGASYRCACLVWHAPSAGHRHCEISAVAIRNPDGIIREWIGTLVDEHERESAQKELREADRRKDDFLAMLSHELRNPLAPILSAVEILDRTGPGREEVASRHRGVIARQVHHMKRLLDDLLDVSRVSQGKIELRREPLELNAVLMQAVEVGRPMIVAKRHQLSVTLAPGLVPLEADPTRLVQVFANLLNNAAKYTDDGGHIALDMTIADGQAVVSVRDDGIGMRPEFIASAFDLFVQDTRSLDRAQGGLGIGLTMVQILVKMHGGSVRASSQGLGRGSTFVVTLPLAPGARAQVPRDAPSATPAPERPLRVLLVDDNVDAAKAMGYLIETLGHQVTLAFDGPGALAAADARPPELVLLDIGLPGMDGYSVAARLRAAGHDRAALIAMTGYGQSEHVDRSIEAGFDRHLVKPVDFAVIAEICAQVRSPRPT